jgi:hypothetical protein
MLVLAVIALVAALVAFVGLRARGARAGHDASVATS